MVAWHRSAVKILQDLPTQMFSADMSPVPGERLAEDGHGSGFEAVRLLLAVPDGVCHPSHRRLVVLQHMGVDLSLQVLHEPHVTSELLARHMLHKAGKHAPLNCVCVLARAWLAKDSPAGPKPWSQGGRLYLAQAQAGLYVSRWTRDAQSRLELCPAQAADTNQSHHCSDIIWRYLEAEPARALDLQAVPHSHQGFPVAWPVASENGLGAGLHSRRRSGQRQLQAEAPAPRVTGKSLQGLSILVMAGSRVSSRQQQRCLARRHVRINVLVLRL